MKLRNRRLIAAKLSLNGLAEVLQQMKTISDLPRLRRALTRGLRIKASTVAAYRSCGTGLSMGHANPTRSPRTRAPPTLALRGPEELPAVATLEIRDPRKTFGGVVALAGVDVTIQSEEILGVIGPNGSGTAARRSLSTRVRSSRSSARTARASRRS